LIVPQFNTVTFAAGIEGLEGEVTIPQSPRPIRVSPA